MIENKIGKYKIIRLIGEGGMASVYEAEHEMLGTKVAIKVLNPILSANAQIKERFRNEAKLMASLDHPNITKVIDFDEQPQQLSIVMEFLNGEDLNDKIKRNGPLTEKEITDVFSQTLSAFQYAHEKGIVHRDIKPSNIFILKNGHVKILDFGIAKLFGQGNEMTQTGTQMGTPIYMSPEQVKADKSIDHRSDIYSLGVTMFYAINGKPPYNSDTDSQFDIFNKIVYEPLPEFSAQNNHHLIVSKACEKNREERFQTCFEFLQAFSLTSLNPESNEKTIIDEKIANNKKEEKTILNVESDSNNQNVENSNFPNKAKNPNNKKNTILIITALALFILGVWGVFNFNNQTTNDNVSSTDNPITDTMSLANVADSTSIIEKKPIESDKKEEKEKGTLAEIRFKANKANSREILNKIVLGDRSNKTITYEEAKKYCESLGSNWRMPNRKEMRAIYEFKDSIGFFGYYYWTSDLATKDKAWYQYMYDGTQIAVPLSNLNFVWPVKNR
jgi:serine/threonine protein kinase